jgi:hypothetical protein
MGQAADRFCACLEVRRSDLSIAVAAKSADVVQIAGDGEQWIVTRSRRAGVSGIDGVIVMVRTGRGGAGE